MRFSRSTEDDPNWQSSDWLSIIPPLPRPDLIVRLVEGEVVILDRSAGRVHHLNATASCIWSACDGTQSVSEIVACVVDKFDGASETVIRDVMIALAQFQELGLLTGD
jgi:Coenzyme PQQ synthesis protein D (PqqD)